MLLSDLVQHPFSGLTSSQFRASAHFDKLFPSNCSPLLLLPFQPHPTTFPRITNTKAPGRNKRASQGWPFLQGSFANAILELHTERNIISKGPLLFKDIFLVPITMINNAYDEPWPALGSGTSRQLAGILGNRILGNFIITVLSVASLEKIPNMVKGWTDL